MIPPELTFYELSQADEPTFKRVVDRFTKQSCDIRNNNNNNEAKRRRLSQDSGYGSQDQWSPTAVPGVISKVILKDFMCHHYMEIDFETQINFLLGQNGSGKSAVLTGVIVALGGSAANTGRGTSVQSFIRRDCNVATIICHLKNNGKRSFKQEKYGDEIIVVRTIRQGGCSVELKNSRGVKVSGRKEDLLSMTRAFGIQVDNPICVLDQNTSRTFLKKTTPEKTYEFFMKSTFMQTLKNTYNSVALTVLKCAEEMRIKEKYYEESTTELKEAQKKYNMYVNQGKDRAQKELLQLEFLWASARDDKVAVTSTTKELEKVEKKISLLQESLSDSGNDSLAQKLEALNESIKTSDLKDKDLEHEISSVKKRGKELVQNIKLCKLEESELSKLIASEEVDINEYKEEIKVQENKMRPEYLQIRQQQQEEVESLQEALASKESEERENVAKVNEFRQSLSVNTGAKQTLKFSKNSHCNQLRGAQRELQGLETETSNMALYSRYMPDLVLKVEAAHKLGRFQKKPIGPIGHYIKVKNSKWTLAVESAIGARILSCFIVDNKHDEEVFQNLVKQVTAKGGPTVVVTKFLNQVHDTHEDDAHSERYSTVMQMVEISSPVAANFLIDFCELYTVLLIPTDDECHAWLSEERNVPLNCKRAYTTGGDVYHPAPRYRTYAGHLAKPRILQASRIDLIRETKQRISELQQNLQQEEQQLKELNKKEEELKALIRNMESEIKNLKDEQLEIQAQIERLKDQEQPDLSTVAALKEELQEKEINAQKKRDDFKKYQTKVKELMENLNDSKKTLAELKSKSKDLHSEREQFQRECQKVRDEQQEFDLSLSDKKKRLDHAEKNLNQLQNSIKELEMKHIKTLQDALKMENHIKNCLTEKGEEYISLKDTERSTERITKELHTLEKKLKSVERALGDTENNISREFHEKVQKSKTCKQYLDALKENVNLLNVVLEERLKLYHTQKVWLSAVISHHFTRVLRFRGCSGRLHFDPAKKTVDILVAPTDGGNQTGQGTSTLSGGESSYTTLSFVIALWIGTEIPFYFMDEIDVFMDEVNKSLAYQLMIKYARQKKQNQFVFLTPLALQGVTVDDGITVQRMQNPRS